MRFLAYAIICFQHNLGAPLDSFPCVTGRFTPLSSGLLPILSTRCRYGVAACGTPAQAISYLEIAVWTTGDAYLVAKRDNEGYGFR
jgi:hypothetical protein